MSSKKIAIPGASRAGGTLFTIAPERLVIITDKKHPLYDPRVEKPLTSEFIDSIVAMGVIEVIIVHKDGDKLVVTSGRRRTRGAIAANKLRAERGLPPLEVQVRLRREVDDASTFETNIISNAHRENDDVIANAENALRYINTFGRTEDNAARIWGVGVATIKIWVKVADLIPEVRAAVRAGQLSFHDAIKNLSGVSRSEQKAALERFIASSPTALRTAAAAGEAAGEEEEGSEDGEGGGETREKAKKGLSPIARLRLLYRSEEAMAALSPRERALVGWVFGSVSSTELKEKNEALAEALTSARRKAGRKATVKGTKAAAADAEARDEEDDESSSERRPAFKNGKSTSQFPRVAGRGAVQVS